MHEAALNKAEMDLHQALRKSHCDHAKGDDEGHECVGVTIISRHGVALNCKLCGKNNLEDAVRIGAEARTHLRVLAYDVGNAASKLERLLYEEEHPWNAVDADNI